MKIAVSAVEGSPSAAIEPRFGRTPVFVVHDTEADTFDVLDNQVNLQAVQGAGIQAAEHVVSSGATVVLTGHCGPKAHRVLSAAGVAVYVGLTGTVAEGIQSLLSEALTPSTEPDVEGHHLRGFVSPDYSPGAWVPHIIHAR